jgi:hypothetical protein
MCAIGSVWLHSGEDWKQIPLSLGLVPQLTTSYPPFIESINADVSIRQQDPASLMALEIRTSSAWRWNLGQFWVQVSTSWSPAKFVALPPSDYMRVLFVLNRVPPEGNDPLNVLVSSRNSRAEDLLSYLSRGDFASARMVGGGVVEEAEQLLYEKRKDPAGAAIGGYFLLWADRLERLHDWTRNLADWFPWMPDGCVIDAWHLLRKEPSDLKSARGRLIQASERGIPLYTVGLRLLFDGLNILHQHDRQHVDVAAALEGVRLYAATADWEATTTTCFGQHPANPKLLVPRGDALVPPSLQPFRRWDPERIMPLSDSKWWEEEKRTG